MYKVSIIIPFYNADRYIDRILDSLLRQDLPYEEYEIIVVDDGSKDDPVTLKSYTDRYSNIKYVRQENSGPGAARNKGIELSTGEYIWFCDSDDYVAKNCIGSLYRIAHENNLDMLFFNVPRITQYEDVDDFNFNFDEIQFFPTGKDFFSLPIKNEFRTMGVWQFIISRSVILKCALRFPANMIMNEDAFFLTDAILSVNRTAKIDADVYFYIQNPMSLIHYSGKILQAERFSADRLLFIKKLDEIVRNREKAMQIPKGCLDNFYWIKNDKSYVLLGQACKYLPAKKFKKVMYELIEIESFPKPFGKRKFKKAIVLNKIVLRGLNLLYGIKRKNAQKFL